MANKKTRHLVKSRTGRKIHLLSIKGKLSECGDFEHDKADIVKSGTINKTELCPKCLLKIDIEDIDFGGKYTIADDGPIDHYGRPLKWNSPEELEELCQEYFRSCWEYRRDAEGKHILDEKGYKIPVRQFRPYTISGLAVDLGTCRQTLLNYSQKDEYLDTIKKAKGIIECYVEERLMTGKATGPIFNLKNNFPGWKEKFELNTTSRTLGVITEAADVKEASQMYAELVKGDGE